MGEVPALTASLLDRNDIKVTPPRNWTWTAASPWPPLQQVQACNLWHHAAYADVRARLLRPAAEFRIETGSDFVSVQMVAGGAGIAGGDVLTHGDDAMPEVCASRPPSAGPGGSSR
jgi:DNA-binding transcriptional LysR family regulator